MAETYLGKVSNLAFGGEGIVRNEGLVVFIPFTAIGDEIHYRINQRKKNFAKGELIEILKASKERTKPLCPYYGSCGGCQLQHLTYEAQLESKRQWVEDALKKQAGLDGIEVPPVLAAEQQWGYRRRISLILRPHHGTYHAGYIALDNHSLIPIAQCPIFIPQEDSLLRKIQELVRQIPSQGNEDGKLTILKIEPEGFFLHFHFRRLPKNIENILKNAHMTNPEWLSIGASSPGKSFQIGQLETEIEVGNLRFTFSPKTFIQNHPAQSLKIYQRICAEANFLKKGNVLDLYCGVGISSLLLSKEGFSVTGIEFNAEAVRLANRNATKNGLSQTQFIQADVGKVLEKMLISKKPELVVVNPPREGLAVEVLHALNAHPPPTLIYISCMPPTLARDLKKLCNSKFKVVSIQAFDMFPQTTHLETLIVLQRNRPLA